METAARPPPARCCQAIQNVSLDKGYHSPANQQRLAEVVAFPVLPKKGKCNAAEQKR